MIIWKPRERLLIWSCEKKRKVHQPKSYKERRHGILASTQITNSKYINKYKNTHNTYSHNKQHEGDDVSRFFASCRGHSNWHFSILVRLHLKFSRACFYQNNTIKREAHIKISRCRRLSKGTTTAPLRESLKKSRIFSAHTLPAPHLWIFADRVCFY